MVSDNIFLNLAYKKIALIVVLFIFLFLDVVYLIK